MAPATDRMLTTHRCPAEAQTGGDFGVARCPDGRSRRSAPAGRPSKPRLSHEMPLGECHGFPDCRRLIRVGGAPVPIGLALMPLDVADTALGQPLVQSRGA